MAKLTIKIFQIITGDIVSKGFAFLATIYLTRTLGTEGYGYITIALSYLGYCVFFADFGLFNIGVREIAKDPIHRNVSPFQILLTRIVFAFTVFGIAWTTLPFIIEDSLLLSLTRSFLFALLAHAFLIEWYFNGTQQFGITALSKTIHTSIYAIGAILIVDGINDLDKLPSIYTGSFIVAVFLLLGIAFSNKAFKFQFGNISDFKGLIKTSSSIGTGLIFAQIVQLLPPIAIGIYISTSDAGLFSAAYKLIIIGMLIDRLFVQLLIPNLSRIWSENENEASIQMGHSSKLMLVIGGSVSLGFALCASDLTALLFGIEFTYSAPIVVALCLFLFFTFQNSMFSHGLVAIGKDSKFFFATSIGGSIAIAGILLSANYLDTTYVGLSVAIGEFIIACCCYFWFKQYLKFSYWLEFLATLGCGIAIYYGAFYFNLPSIIEAILGITLFISLLYFGKVIQPKNISWAKSMIRK